MTTPARRHLAQPIRLVTRLPLALLGALALACGAALAAAAPTEINTASQAELEQAKGIGVAMSDRLLKARAEQRFVDWQDLMARVPGLGPRLAQRLSDQGLRVNGQGYAPPAPVHAGSASLPAASH